MPNIWKKKKKYIKSVTMSYFYAFLQYNNNNKIATEKSREREKNEM